MEVWQLAGVEDAGGLAVASLAEDPLYRMGVRQPPVYTILVCDRAAVANSWMEPPVKSWVVAGGPDIAGLEDHACMRAVAALVYVDSRAAKVVGAVEVEVPGVVKGALSHSARDGSLAACPAVLTDLDYEGWVAGTSLGSVVEGESEAHRLVHLGLALLAEGHHPWAGEEAVSDRLDAVFALIASVEGKAVPCLEVEGEPVAALATALTVVGPVGAVGARRPEVLWRRYLARWPGSLISWTYPRTQPTVLDTDGKSFPADQHVGRGGPSWCRWVSRSPEEAREGRHEAPISRWGIDMSCHGRRRGWCLRDGGGGQRRHCRMYGRPSSVRVTGIEREPGLRRYTCD